MGERKAWAQSTASIAVLVYCDTFLGNKSGELCIQVRNCLQCAEGPEKDAPCLSVAASECEDLTAAEKREYGDHRGFPKHLGGAHMHHIGDLNLTIQKGK